MMGGASQRDEAAEARPPCPPAIAAWPPGPVQWPANVPAPVRPGCSGAAPNLATSRWGGGTLRQIPPASFRDAAAAPWPV